jgi:hypothetical protein
MADKKMENVAPKKAPKKDPKQGLKGPKKLGDTKLMIIVL